jgi:hypothetical protein
LILDYSGSMNETIAAAVVASAFENIKNVNTAQVLISK